MERKSVLRLSSSVMKALDGTKVTKENVPNNLLKVKTAHTHKDPSSAVSPQAVRPIKGVTLFKCSGLRRGKISF